MSEYKASLYNLTAYDLNGDLLVSNLLNYKFVKFSANKFEHSIDELRDMLVGNKELNDEIKQYKELIEGGFIVDQGFDESNLADYRYGDLVYSNNILELTIIPTDACNFKCIYCYEESNVYTKMTNEVEESILRYIQKNVSKYKKLKVNWFGGEPLLMKDLIVDFMSKVIEICKKKGVPVISAMTTNGYELDEDTFRELLKVKVCFYQITIDGIKETHNAQRPHKIKNDSYERIMSNLNHIMNDVESYFKIVLRINMTKSALKYQDKYIDEMEKFSKDERFSISWEKVADYGGEKVHNMANDMLEDKDEYSHLLDKSTERGIASSYITNFGIGAALCTANRKNAYYINTDGKVFKCSLAIYSKEYSDANTVGYITRNGDMMIDEEKNSKWLVRDLMNEDCKKCVYYPICFSAICPYRNKMQKRRVCFKRLEMSEAYMRSMSKQGFFKEIGEKVYGI